MAWAPVFERMAAELRALVPGRERTPSVTVTIAPGDLIDKITILEIKAERIADAAKLPNVMLELETLQAARDRTNLPTDALQSPIAELRPGEFYGTRRKTMRANINKIKFWKIL